MNVFYPAVAKRADYRFNPRREKWGEHFVVGSDNTLQGITGTGRATISRLRLNTPAQIGAREQWIVLGLWP